MELAWPFVALFSEELHLLLDQYLDVILNLLETRTITRIKETFAGFNSDYEIVSGVAVIMIILFAVALFSVLKKWPLVLPSRSGLHPPPGTMGWPFFGETAQLKAKRLAFYLEKRKKYGEMFKSHLFGNACIVTTSSQAAKFMLVDHPELFRQRGLPCVERMLAETHFFGYTEKHGFHLRLRKHLHGLIAQLPNIIPQLEVQALSLMRTWLGGREVHVLQETKLFAVNASIIYILGLLPSEVSRELTQACESIIHGLEGWRVYLPWTKYYKACKGRRKASRIINQIIREQRSMTEKSTRGTNVLGVLMEEHETIKPLTDRELQENILTMLFAAHDASATVLTWAMKYLKEDHVLFDNFRKEHDRIADRKATADLPLTWDDIKDMLLTQRVIKETLRMASPIDFSCREAIQDTAYDGFLIPKGWLVLVVHKTFHLDPQLWHRPHKFDATRFEVMPRPYTYTPFGNGAHVCLGRELAQLEIFIFLHHFTTKFRWEECKCSHATATMAINVPLHITVRDYFIRLHPRESSIEFTTDDTYASVVRDWDD